MQGISRVLQRRNYLKRKTKEGMRSFKRTDKHSMSITDGEKGSRASSISNASGIGMNITMQVTGVRFRSCGTVG